MATTYLTKTPSSAGNRKTWTYSAWVKLNSTATMQLFSAGVDSGNYNSLRITQTGLRVTNYNSSNTWNLRTNRLLKDLFAWYHIVLRVDTTQSTASDRARLYINGELQTSLLESTYPAQNQDEYVNNTNLHAIGTTVPVNSNNFDGLMTHVHLCDGYSYDASSFGSTDSTTGEWTINTSPSVSYGTNGFFILKDGNSVTDQSGQSNNYTVANGTLVDYVDNPDNNFCVLNNRMEIPGSTVYNASSEVSNTNGTHKTIYGSIPFTSGKYYWEAKAKSGSAVKHTLGISDVRNSYNYRQNSSANTLVADSSNSYGRGDAIGYYYSTINKNGSAVASSIHQIANNDIMMVACDADNGKIYFGVNGTWRVANSTTFNASNHDTTFTTGRFYLPAFSNENCGWFTNFGNGYFGATAISSAGTNASGIGTFEYDVPTGFTALSTKGLNE